MRNTIAAIVGMGLLTTLGCADRQARQEKEAERMYVTTGDLEEDLQTLPEAIARYRNIVERYPDTQAAKKAQERHLKLQEAQKLLAKLETVHEDSLAGFYERVCEVIPDYLAVLKKLGAVYYKDINLTSRTAARFRSKRLAERVLGVWSKQDGLWSGYAFRPISEDRRWRDRLCAQAVDVARMLEEFRRHEEALKVVNRGLEYGVGEDVKAHARVFAAFYTFRMARNREGIALAEDALSYAFLPTEDQARAYHVIGLCYTYLHQETGELADLDAAIEALNMSVNIDSSMKHARDLLKKLRIQRRRLQVSMK